MNSGVSNCIEVRKFWKYSTDLRTNISNRDRIFFLKFFYRFRFEFELYRIELHRLVSKCTNIAVTYQEPAFTLFRPTAIDRIKPHCSAATSNIPHTTLRLYRKDNTPVYR